MVREFGTIKSYTDIAGMTTAPTISRLRDADPAFNDAVEQARRDYRSGLRQKFVRSGDEVEDNKLAFIVAMKRGAKVDDIINAGQIVDRKEYREWVRDDQDFREQVFALCGADWDAIDADEKPRS
jgi:hypothetical protein